MRLHCLNLITGMSHRYPSSIEHAEHKFLNALLPYRAHAGLSPPDSSACTYSLKRLGAKCQKWCKSLESHSRFFFHSCIPIYQATVIESPP